MIVEAVFGRDAIEGEGLTTLNKYVTALVAGIKHAAWDKWETKGRNWQKKVDGLKTKVEKGWEDVEKDKMTEKQQVDVVKPLISTSFALTDMYKQIPTFKNITSAEALEEEISSIGEKAKNGEGESFVDWT